jgi:uncharacterized protein YkwD
MSSHEIRRATLTGAAALFLLASGVAVRVSAEEPANTVAEAAQEMAPVSPLPSTTPAAAATSPAGESQIAAAAADELGDERQHLLRELVARRAAMGLPALDSPPELQAAAQAHAEAMAAGGWFGFTSPDGQSVEKRVMDAGHAATLVAAKIFRAPTADEPAALASRWWGEGGDPGRNSLFHSQVSAAGLGIARRGDELFYAFVLTRPAVPPATADADELAQHRTAFLAALNAARAERGMAALRHDAALERAAQEHAKDLLAALRAGQPTSTVETLVHRVAEERRLVGTPQLTGGSTIWQQRSGSMRTSSGLRGAAVGQAVVVDARDVDEAIATLLAQETASDLMQPGYLLGGVGVVVDEAGPEPNAVWVACMTRN